MPTADSMRSNTALMERRTMPGSCGVPSMECVLPVPVWPYAKTVPL